MIILFWIFGFFSWTQGQQFTSSFTVTASAYNRGYFSGKLFYDWDAKSLLIQFPTAKDYAELYKFNSMRGLDSHLLNGQFYAQYLYRTSSFCSCETNSLNYAMPPFFLSPIITYDTNIPVWVDSGTTKVFPLGTCKHYTPNPSFDSVSLITDYWQTNSGTPCAFTLKDGRTFTLSTVTTGAIPAETFTAPKNCKCSKPLDIVISLDRSGSISQYEWTIEHQFVQNITNAFEFGPLATNMAILNWNKNQWTSLKLVDGTSKNSVETAIDAMTCCSSPSNTPTTSSCCCCGTPIGGGLWVAGQEMLTSSRLATKVIIVLTDGCQNHIFDETKNPPVLKPCSCSGEVACASDPVCGGDLIKHYQTVTQAIPGVSIIALGVGASSGALQEICPNQLLLVAGGIKSMVFNPQSWEQLSGFVESIAATACSVSQSLCPKDCCGICSCGKCIPPPNCVDKDYCTLTQADSNTGCCVDTPAICETKSCLIPKCIPDIGCQFDPVLCKTNETCFTYHCNFDTDSCVATKICPEPECTTDRNCSDNRLCTTDACINETCVYTPIPCGVTDKCAKRSCDPETGKCKEVLTICDDKNNCTNDSCDPSTGCVFTDIVCPPSDDECNVPSCLPSRGCTNTRKSCEMYQSDNCTIWSCRNGTCQNQSYICAPPPPSEGIEVGTIVGASIGAGAIAGIIVAAVLACFGLAGGGAIAYTQTATGGAAPEVINNPLYAGKGNAATNPLFKS